MAGNGVEPRPPDFRRLRWIAVVVPIAFVWLYEFVRLVFIDRTFRMEIGHILSGLVMGLAVLGFALVMFFFLERAQRQVLAQNRELAIVNEELRRREREAQALYRAALRLSSHAPLPEMLDTIAHDARELLACDQAVVCVADRQTGSLAPGSWTDRLALGDDGAICLVPHRAGLPDRHEANPLCPMRLRGEGISWIAVPLRSSREPLGELCVTRLDGRPFSEPEQTLLAALADLASIAVSTARMRDTEEQWLILKERDRIARELHDSMAQVLGVIHLRLRGLLGRAGRDGLAPLHAELDELAGVADEAYRDVREAILGLRESISPEAGLVGTLREYVGKFGRQSGIEAFLIVEGGVLPALTPASEVQLLRVIQEALTNVRKHAGARSAVVRIEAGGEATSIAIEDDGVGFDPALVADMLERGFGTRAMRERMEQIGGTLEIDSAPGRGTRVIARLPVGADQEQRRVAGVVAREGATGAGGRIGGAGRGPGPGAGRSAALAAGADPRPAGR